MSIKNTLNEMSDEGLSSLEAELNAVKEGRRKKFDLEDIKPGMTPEALAAARAEVAKALRESGHSK